MWADPDCHPATTQICKICKLHVSSWNVGTMSGRASEVETIGHRHINICCVQESHWKCCSASSAYYRKEGHACNFSEKGQKMFKNGKIGQKI